MRRYLAGRLLQAAGVVFFVATLTFVIVHLAPGDPIAAALARPGVTEAVRDEWRRSLGLDLPVAEQYVRWLRNTVSGNLGYSIGHRRAVSAVLADALPRTLLLVVPALVLSFALGIGVGILQAERPRGRRDRWLGRVLLALYSVPDFWLALLVLLLFAYRLPWFPAGGMIDPVLHEYLGFGARLADRLRHLVLPIVTLALLGAASIARYQRTALLDVLPSDFMRTAVAKGLPWRTAVRTHALRNALLPVITLAGLQLPLLVAGSVFVERVYSWPGMGLMTINAVAARDYALVSAGVVVFSTVVAVGALLADITVALVDPRIRVE
ncbi:MAG: ABC transporter permease [Gemmatimonadaceae bacterium]|nr:ABC transporter permease [Gemmatimonadaceae bacterium]